MVTPGFEGLEEGGDSKGWEIGGGGLTPGFEFDGLEGEGDNTGLEVGGGVVFDMVGKANEEKDDDVFVLLELIGGIGEGANDDCCFFLERRWKTTNTMIPVIVNNTTIPTVIPMIKPQFFDCGGEEEGGKLNGGKEKKGKGEVLLVSGRKGG